MTASDEWEIVTDVQLHNKMDIAHLLGYFQYIAYKYIVPFSPMFYLQDNPVPGTDRYNFNNFSLVVYHEAVLLHLTSQIVGLSQGQEFVQASVDGYMTREQFAAFCYLFSTMSLPRDMSGRYPGGVSGDKEVDDFIAGILDSAVTSDMTDNQKVKAIYDYIIYNFRHDSNSFPIFIVDDSDNANPLSDAIAFSSPIRKTGKGTCDVFANTLRLAALRLGYECNYVSGQYVNRDGSTYGHGWNQIKIDDEWYWFDVDIEGSVFHKGNSSEPSYFLFMKKDVDWVSNHNWNKDKWPAADSLKYPMELSRQGEPEPVSQ